MTFPRNGSRIQSLALALCLTLNSALAQDIHFTQFTHSPQLQWGSLAGSHEGAGVIYRSQWRSIDKPFVTASAFGETYLSLGFDKLGLGAVVLHDQAGPGQLTANAVWLGLSYHLSLGKTTVIAGLQPGYVWRSVQPVTMPSHYDPAIGDFNPALVVEPIFPIRHFDLNGGLALQIQSGQSKVVLSQAVQHILRPNYSFLNDPYNRLPMRHTTMLIVDGPLGATMRIMPSLFFSKHNGATELNLQSRLYIDFSANTDLVGGIGLRNNTTGFDDVRLIKATDAGFLIAGFTYGDAEFSVAYDFNVSGLHRASNYRGAYELAVIWRNTRRVQQREVVVPCIRI